MTEIKISAYNVTGDAVVAAINAHIPCEQLAEVETMVDIINKNTHYRYVVEVV